MSTISELGKIWEVFQFFLLGYHHPSTKVRSKKIYCTDIVQTHTHHFGQNLLISINRKFQVVGILHFLALHRYCTSYKLEVCGKAAPSQSINTIFSSSICSLPVSLSHFGNSQNILNFFCVILFAMVFCDQWSLILLSQKITTRWRLRWWLPLLSNSFSHLAEYSIM